LSFISKFNILLYQAVEIFEDQFNNPEFESKLLLEKERNIAEKSPLEVNE